MAILLTVVESSDMTPHLDQWRAHMAAQRLSHRTITDRIQLINRASAGTGQPPEAMTADALVSWSARQRWAASTAQTYHSALVAWHRWLRAQGLRRDDPTDLMPRPRTPRHDPRPISTSQLARVLGTRMHRRTRGMILLAALGGLRVHEVARFRGEDLDRDTGTIYVTGKGGVAAAVPAHPLIVEFAASMPIRGFWFTTHVGPGRGRSPIASRSVSTIIRQVMERAGVPGTAHALRHWFGTTLVASGADLRTTQTLLRHASLATTQIYTRVSDGRRAKAIDRLDPFYDERMAA